jgi:hypothetical protein
VLNEYLRNESVKMNLKFDLKANEITVAIIAVVVLLLVLLSLIAWNMVPEKKTSTADTQSRSLPKQESYRNNQVAQQKCRTIIEQKFFEYGERIYSWQVDYDSSQYDELRDQFMIFYNLLIIKNPNTPNEIRVDNWASCKMRALDYKLIEFQTKKR